MTWKMLRGAALCGLVWATALEPSTAVAQATFDQTVAELSSQDAGTRLRAVRLLKEAAYPEAAEPLARAIADSEDAVQADAIAAELNIFLAEKVIPKRRVGYVVEVRSKVAAEAAFTRGPQALNGGVVPPAVLTALRAAFHDDNPSIALDALYAFGALAANAGRGARADLLHAAAPDLAGMLGSTDPALRLAALRVTARVFARQPGDAPIEATLGDAVITALNERDRRTRQAAMAALGAARYERAVDALTQLFQYYGKGDDAAAALDALARIAHSTSAPTFVAQIASRDAALRVIAIEGLARSGDRARLADVQSAAAGERNETIALAVSFASARLTGAPIDPIVEALGRPKLRDLAQSYLVDVVVGRGASLGRYLQDPDPRVRADVIDAIGLSGDPAGLPLVQAYLKDADPQVAMAAARAVTRLR